MPRSRSKPIRPASKPARFRGYRAAGVNRVSLGVQALDDRVLDELGRLHSAREAIEAVHIARSVFERYSFDLIYARPQQTPREWADELKLALARSRRASFALSAHHRAGYAVRGAPCGRQAHVPDDDTARALYDTTQDICAAHGLPAYEISNHARPGAECRHNLVYWRMHEYAGVGPGAHGRLDIDGDRHATATEKRPESWLTRVEQEGHGLVTDEVLTREETADEFLLMGLRLAEGIDPERYAALAGRPLDRVAHRGFARTRAGRDDCRPADCASACRVFPCSMRSSPISRRDKRSRLAASMPLPRRVRTKTARRRPG